MYHSLEKVRAALYPRMARLLDLPPGALIEWRPSRRLNEALAAAIERGIKHDDAMEKSGQNRR